jgi:prepilin-type N-terminal cleavage/methylation domain-containing protein
MKSTQPAGFSLIEVMLIVAIISILVAIAVPRYVYFQGISKRVEGISYLNLVRLAETSYYSEHDTYTLALNDLDGDGAPSQYSMKFYGLRFLTSSNITLVNGKTVIPGYMATSTGNIDDDQTVDVLLLKVGDPMIPIVATSPEGISVYSDDLID